MQQTPSITERNIRARILSVIAGASDESVEDIFDDVQLLFNDDALSITFYRYAIYLLSPALEQEFAQR